MKKVLKKTETNYEMIRVIRMHEEASRLDRVPSLQLKVHDDTALWINCSSLKPADTLLTIQINVAVGLLSNSIVIRSNKNDNYLGSKYY